MAGDPLRDAFRNQLATVRAALVATHPGIFAVVDTLNTVESPGVAAGYLELEFPGGSEAQSSFGAPGANLFRETGQVTVNVKSRLGAGTTAREAAETYATAIRDAFRSQAYRLFTAAGRQVRITNTQPMGGGYDEGGMWVESVALGYERYIVA